MVENLVATYTCPFCGSKEISEKHIDIVGAAGNTVNIDMHCPSCNKHFMAKTELVHMELGNISPEKMSQIQNSLMALKNKLWWEIEIQEPWLLEDQPQNTSDGIKEENILHIMKSMKKRGFTAGDLFWQDITEWNELS